MKSEIITQVSQQLIQEWESLWDSSSNSNYINGPQWFCSVRENYNYPDYAIVTVRDNKKLIGICGLLKHTKYGINFYSLPPEDFVCGTPFLIYDNNETCLREMIKCLVERGNIFLDNVDIDFSNKLSSVTPFSKFTIYNENYYIPILDKHTNPVKQSKKNEYLKKIKNIEAKVQLSVEYGYSEKTLSDIFSIDNLSRKKQRGYNAFSNQQLRNFYSSLAKRLSQGFVVHKLFIGGKIVAYSIGFIVKNIYLGSQMAFDETYSQYLPGKVLMIKLIEDLYENGVDVIDMGSGENSLKKELSPAHKQLLKGVISKSLLIREYVNFVYKFKLLIYKLISSNRRIYSYYRKIKNKFI